MALEIGPKQIRVNAIAPGNIRTPTNSALVSGDDAVRETEEKIAMGRMGTPEEVADVVAFLFRYAYLHLYQVHFTDISISALKVVI